MIRRHLGSVRARTTLVATALTAVVLILGALAIVQLVERNLVDGARSALEDAYSAAQEQVGDGEAGERRVVPVAEGDDVLLLTFVQPSEDHSGDVLGYLLEPGDSEPVASVRFDPSNGRILSMEGSAGEDLEEINLATALAGLDGGESAERAAARVLSEASLEEVRESVDAVTAALLLIVPALVLILGVTIWFMVGRALRPVHAISEQVASISPTTLDERVPVPASEDEIAELATLMNQMLDRIEIGADRQRQFVADASHELRSPLSTIKAAAEVAQASDDPARFGDLADDVAAEADRMDTLIADLLDLASLDEGREPPTARLDLRETCRSAVGRVGVDDPAVELVVLPTPVMVIGDDGQLERAIFNLAGNAVQHADQHVRVSLATGSGSAVVHVDDDGVGVPEADRDRVFERFVRLDRSRTREAGGAGIGLALVAAVAGRHGGTVSVTDAPDLGGARFTLRIPLAVD